MPQFDIITFFTQIFWLTIIFFGFYFVSLDSLLPRIAAVLKSRRKKLAQGSLGVSNLTEEQGSVKSLRDLSVESSANNSKASVSFMIASGNKWLLSSILGFNNSKMEAYQNFYVKLFGNAILATRRNKIS